MLTSEQKLKVCEILGVTPLALDAQISFLGEQLTPEIETAIGEKIASWDSVSKNFSSFTPTESNKGFNLSAEAPKNDIRSAIANWLECPEWARSHGIGRLRRS